MLFPFLSIHSVLGGWVYPPSHYHHHHQGEGGWNLTTAQVKIAAKHLVIHNDLLLSVYSTYSPLRWPETDPENLQGRGYQ